MVSEELKVFECLDLLEKKAYELYKLLYEKTTDARAKASFYFISIDSYKHHLIYSLFLGAKSDYDDNLSYCKEELGNLFMQTLKTSDDLMEKIKKVEKLTFEDIKAIIQELIDIEKNVDEETYCQGIVNALSKIEEDKVKTISFILNYIKEDEIRHKNILLSIIA